MRVALPFRLRKRLQELLPNRQCYRHCLDQPLICSALPMLLNQSSIDRQNQQRLPAHIRLLLPLLHSFVQGWHSERQYAAIPLRLCLCWPFLVRHSGGLPFSGHPDDDAAQSNCHRCPNHQLRLTMQARNTALQSRLLKNTGQQTLCAIQYDCSSVAVSIDSSNNSVFAIRYIPDFYRSGCSAGYLASYRRRYDADKISSGV